MASFDALDLSYEVGTWDIAPSFEIKAGIRSKIQRHVSFATKVELYVSTGHHLAMTCWPLSIEVPHAEAWVLRSLSDQSPLAGLQQDFDPNDGGISSFLATHAAGHAAVRHVNS